jgi:hypothetical protein
MTVVFLVSLHLLDRFQVVWHWKLPRGAPLVSEILSLIIEDMSPTHSAALNDDGTIAKIQSAIRWVTYEKMDQIFRM